MTDRVRQLIADWNAARALIRRNEEAAHPDVVDVLGRTWTWKDGDLYRHDSMCWPLSMVTDPRVGWPSRNALDNPNYQWCEICKTGASPPA